MHKYLAIFVKLLRLKRTHISFSERSDNDSWAPLALRLDLKKKNQFPYSGASFDACISDSFISDLFIGGDAFEYRSAHTSSVPLRYK